MVETDSVHSSGASDVDTDVGENDDFDVLIKNQVEDSLYSVSTRMLLDESQVFGKIYRLRPSKDSKHAAEAIIVLPREVKCEEFGALLKVLCSDSCIFRKPSLTKEEWTSVLKLSTLWHFIDARNFAIKNLRPLISSLDRVVLGRDFYVSGWVKSGLQRFASRKRTIEDDEAEKLLFYTTIKLLRIREQRRSKLESFDLVAEVFKDELDFLRSQEETFIFAKDLNSDVGVKMESPVQK
ncbi:hypothetical protein HYPSUDRAFT_61599 [Hypholoma sublateritium FD-334 SS-4]|uniref:BTB domain-containing protein n=1 Tax=Hypholoma sublateritium (strain FD-334 SS-4) TaxID=945553 RepID=A0A0D2PK56_HYPSF|nr:hypothetical protein HYPSUDRAFT_61599 [Hypholoma sublateritium FD-334 SS-4]